MLPTLFERHKLTSPKLTYKLYLLMCAAFTSLFWVLATNQPIKAQVNPEFGGLLPVPQSPVTSTKAAAQAVPPPPSNEWQSSVSPIGTGLGSVNTLLSKEPSQSLGQLENSFIQQSKTSSASQSQPSSVSATPAAQLVQPSSIGGDSSDIELSRKLDSKNGSRFNNSDSLMSQSISGQSNNQSGNTNTQEFTAPSSAPTFNQLLNSPSNPSSFAPLPPLVGESQQPQLSGNLGGNLVTNTTPTFNQLLNGQKAVNQGVNQQVVNSKAPLTFEQILNGQPSGGQQVSPQAPLTYEQILNAQYGNPNQPMASSAPSGFTSLLMPGNPSTATGSPPTFNQILNSQGGAFPAPGEPIRQEELRSQVSQTRQERTNLQQRPSTEARPLLNSTALTEPLLRVEGVYVTQKETSARARVTGIYPLTPNTLFGATLDLVSNGSTFTDSRNEGLNINELYFATSLAGLPNLRFVVGQLDLTSYFDRNSFAKDGASQFFNPVFQTNPALAATGIASRPSLLVNWSVTDNIDAKAAVFSSSNSLSNFTLDGFAGEVGIRYGNAIIRGTYATDRDGGNRDSFPEVFSISRGNGQFGTLRDDREEAYGLNAEVYIPNLKLGLFGRYGRYENRDLNRSADTYVLGASLLDLFTPDDRLGIAYGQALTSDSLRRGDRPDVLEAYYDFPFLSNLRLGFTVQGRDSFEETVLGIRVKSDFDITPRGRVR